MYSLLEVIESLLILCVIVAFFSFFLTLGIYVNSSFYTGPISATRRMKSDCNVKNGRSTGVYTYKVNDKEYIKTKTVKGDKCPDKIDIYYLKRDPDMSEITNPRGGIKTGMIVFVVSVLMSLISGYVASRIESR